MTDEKLVEAAARAAYLEYVDAFGYPNGMATWDELPLAFPDRDGFHHPQGQETWRNVARAALAAVRALRPAGEPEEWRELALQFDGHRIEALSMLRYAERHINEYATVRDILREQLATIRAFLAKPPLSGEEVLAQRLAALASPIIDAKVAEDARAIRIAILKALYGNDVGERPEPTLELLFALIAVAKSGRATPTAANASEGDDLEKGLRKALVHVEEVRVSPQWSGQHADWICGAIRFELEQALLGLLAAAPASPDTKEQGRG